METFKYVFKIILIVALLFQLTGCPPYAKPESPDNSAEVGAVHGMLSKSFTGQEALASMDQLKRSGYPISYQFSTEAEVQSRNGHSGGAFSRNGNEIVIYINRSLNNLDQAHVVLHQLSHIKDDFEIDETLKRYPHVDAAAREYIRNSGYGPFDYRVSTYVLGTLFCSEARAHYKNQTFQAEGAFSAFVVKGPELAQYIDQNYISKYHTSYGSAAESMKSWCLNRSSMLEIQNALVW